MKPNKICKCLAVLLVMNSLFTATADEVELVLEHSQDMSNWTSVEVTPEMLSPDGKILMGDSANAGFFRLRVEIVDGPPVPPVPADFVEISADSFEMGDSFNEGNTDERPVHTVDVSRFYMQSTEVTNAQMAEVMNWAFGQGLVTASTSTVRNVNGDVQELLNMDDSDIRLSWTGSQMVADSGFEDHPVVEVTWYGAVAYCQFRSQMDGLSPCYDFSDWSCDFTKNGYRLPTEAEWEKAARGGLSGKRFSWGDTISHDEANYWAFNSSAYDLSSVGKHPTYSSTNTAPVGSFPGAGGLHDMVGNVWEWCHDWYGSSYYGTSPATDPSGPASGSNRVLRGGSWYDFADDCRVADRRHLISPGRSDYRSGFRPVRR